jgi:hypothetical protein
VLLFVKLEACDVEKKWPTLIGLKRGFLVKLSFTLRIRELEEYAHVGCCKSSCYSRGVPLSTKSWGSGVRQVPA